MSETLRSVSEAVRSMSEAVRSMSEKLRSMSETLRSMSEILPSRKPSAQRQISPIHIGDAPPQCGSGPLLCGPLYVGVHQWATVLHAYSGMILREVKGQKLWTQKLPGGSFTRALLLLGRFYMRSEVTI